MNYRLFENKDYFKYTEWLHSRGRVGPSQDELSEIGYVIFDDENEYAIGFMIDSNMACVLGHFASNPKADSKKRSQAVDFLLDLLIEKARESGYRHALMATNLPRLMERLEKRNFVVFEKDMTHYGRTL